MRGREDQSRWRWEESSLVNPISIDLFKIKLTKIRFTFCILTDDQRIAVLLKCDPWHCVNSLLWKGQFSLCLMSLPSLSSHLLRFSCFLQYLPGTRLMPYSALTLAAGDKPLPDTGACDGYWKPTCLIHSFKQKSLPQICQVHITTLGVRSNRALHPKLCHYTLVKKTALYWGVKVC